MRFLLCLFSNWKRDWAWAYSMDCRDGLSSCDFFTLYHTRDLVGCLLGSHPRVSSFTVDNIQPVSNARSEGTLNAKKQGGFKKPHTYYIANGQAPVNGHEQLGFWKVCKVFKKYIFLVRNMISEHNTFSLVENMVNYTLHCCRINRLHNYSK